MYEPTNIPLAEMCRRMRAAGFRQKTIDSFVEDVRRLPVLADRRADPSRVESREPRSESSQPVLDFDREEAA